MRRLLAGGAAATGIVLLVLLALAGLIDSGHFQGALTRLIASRAQRSVELTGGFTAQLLSLHPRFTATNVVIGNPAWMAPGRMAQIGKLTLVLRAPWFGGPLVIEQLTLEGATLNLRRDIDDRANWQLRQPAPGRAGHLALIHSLSMPDAHVELNDVRHHLQFSGSIAITELVASDRHTLRIIGRGDLNGRPDGFQIDGDSLTRADRTSPYHFRFLSQSGGSELSGTGSLPEPFNFDLLDADYRATGPNLKDLYYLAGVSLLNTGQYELTGRLERRGPETKFSNLSLASGASDLRGEVSIDSSGDRPAFVANVSSQRLRMKDLGERAANQESALPPAPFLFSDAAFNPASVRRSDGAVTYRAQRVDIGRAPLQSVMGKMTLDHGKLVVSSLTASLFGGALAARGQLDSTLDKPRASVDIKMTDLNLGSFLAKGNAPPAMDGLLQLRIIASGRGRSLHQLVSTADGTLTTALARGVMRTSLAELTGIDLRGLGLKLAKSTSETPVSCAAANFRAANGTMTADSIIIDSEPVLIRGGGVVHLDSEALDLQLRGHPKALRLRLPLPIQVSGTLLHPAYGIGTSSASQTAGAEPSAVNCATPPATVQKIGPMPAVRETPRQPGARVLAAGL